MKTLEPFTTAKAHRSASCLTCGHVTTARLEYVLEKRGYGEQVCRVCFWDTWAERGLRAHRTELERAVWSMLALAPDSIEVAQLIQTHAQVREAVDRTWWPDDRIEAMFDKLHHDVIANTADCNDGTNPVITRCRLCAHVSVQLPARMGAEMAGRWCACQSCHQRNGGACAQDIALGFEALGMRVEDPLAKVDTVQQASCARCGVPRSTSLRQLNRGQVPCFACDGAGDTHAECRVYLFHFPAWQCFKVGITNSGNDQRLLVHQRNGGDLIELVTVANRASALWVEALALAMVRAWPITGEPVDQRVCGWTEMWSDRAPVRVRVGELAAGLPAELTAPQAPQHAPVNYGAMPRLEPGMTVCFTGAGMGRTRAQWAELASEAGLTPVVSVRDGIGLLVASQAASGTSKAREATAAAVPVVEYGLFEEAVGQWLSRRRRL